MNFLARDKCCMCGSAQLQDFLTLRNMPVFLGTTTEPEYKDIYFDQEWIICFECGCLQLAKLIPLDLLYARQNSSVAFGGVWEQHHKEFSHFILNDPVSSVCEIGAAHCELATIILKDKPDLDYLIIEPNTINAPSGAKTISGFIEQNMDKASGYQSLIHSHVLEHLYNPREFISNMASIMNDNKKMYISFPNIEAFIEAAGTNSLNFEHTYFLDPDQLKCMLRSHNLLVIREQTYKNHSYFFSVVKTSTLCGEKKLPKIHGKAKAFKDLWLGLDDFVRLVNKTINESSMPTYLFGAHVFSQALLSLNLDSRNILGVLDNSLLKQGQRLYGTILKVFDPKVIKGFKNVRVILKAAQYQDEISRQLLEINSKVQILA